MLAQRFKSILVLSLSLVASAAILPSFAFASETAIKADGQGPGAEGAGETGAPVYGSGCSYAYSIQKIGPTYAEHHDEIKYLIIVKNIGTCKLKHVEVRDYLPHDMEFVEAQPSEKSQEHGEIRWDHIETLKAGEYKLYKVTAKAEGRPWRWATNQACAYTPWVGTTICDAESTYIYNEESQRPESVN